MTFAIKFNGRATSVGGTMRADYECPVHGRFEALVERTSAGDPPDVARCTHSVKARQFWMFGATAEQRADMQRCREQAPWRVSMPAIHTQFVVSATQGKSAAKPHAEALDTRPLAEGRKKEWRLARKRLKEERRHKRVRELLR